ncbi:MAG: hypothetical protein Q4A71_03385 [Actinomycetaceae bacterium]|nr:hypothetical protein [Actinomycetaceae bacterium]
MNIRAYKGIPTWVFGMAIFGALLWGGAWIFNVLDDPNHGANIGLGIIALVGQILIGLGVLIGLIFFFTRRKKS